MALLPVLSELVISRVHGYAYLSIEYENAMFADFFLKPRKIKQGGYLVLNSKGAQQQPLSHLARELKIYPYAIKSIKLAIETKGTIGTEYITCKSKTNVALDGVTRLTYTLTDYLNTLLVDSATKNASIDFPNSILLPLLPDNLSQRHYVDCRQLGTAEHIAKVYYSMNIPLYTADLVAALQKVLEPRFSPYLRKKGIARELSKDAILIDTRSSAYSHTGLITMMT
jgi:hypothetical protein